MPGVTLSVPGALSSGRARDTAATMFDHSRHCGESATKTVKFIVPHTVNCVICNNNTRLTEILLNFTPVIQQNCHQPGRKFEKSFCAVDRLRCQLELSESETSQTPRKLSMLYWTENQCFTTFSNFKHGYTKKFCWSSHIIHWSSHFFIGPRTDKFRGVCQPIQNLVFDIMNWGGILHVKN